MGKKRLLAEESVSDFCYKMGPLHIFCKMVIQIVSCLSVVVVVEVVVLHLVSHTQ